MLCVAGTVRAIGSTVESVISTPSRHNSICSEFTGRPLRREQDLDSITRSGLVSLSEVQIKGGKRLVRGLHRPRGLALDDGAMIAYLEL